MTEKTEELPGIPAKTALGRAAHDYLDQKEVNVEAARKGAVKLDALGERVLDIMVKEGKRGPLTVTNERGGAHTFEVQEGERKLVVKKVKKFNQPG